MLTLAPSTLKVTLSFLLTLIVLFGAAHSAVADAVRCEGLFDSNNIGENRSVLGKFLARQRLLGAMGSRSKTSFSAPGGTISISNPRPEANSKPWTPKRGEPLRLSLAQETIAKEVLARHRLFIQVNGAAEIVPVEGFTAVIAAFNGFATGRYTHRFFVSENSYRVELSGHAIVIMAEIIHALRRIEVPMNPIALPVIVPVMRYGNMREQINRIEHITALTSSELAAIANAKQAERMLGMNEEAVTRWFNDALMAAQLNRGEHQVVTVGLILRSFQTVLGRETTTQVTPETHGKWRQAARRVFDEILIPRLELDLEEALFSSDLALRAAYEDAIATLALPESMLSRHAPNRPFIENLKASYFAQTGRKLTSAEIASHSVNPDLLEVVKRYFLVYKDGFKPRYTQQDFIEFARTGIGDRDFESAYQALSTELVRMGYNRHSVKDALSLLGGRTY